MRPIAHGIDLVPVSRIARMVADHDQRFLDRCFTPAERAYAEPSRRRDEHLAARFAAKEAVMKALGTGLDDGLTWTEIEVVREPSGRPGIALRGRALEIAAALGIHSWLVSLSHTDDHAAASVIALGHTAGV
jgi:holo-[acyl-carrier protein] synthase